MKRQTVVFMWMNWNVNKVLQFPKWDRTKNVKVFPYDMNIPERSIDFSPTPMGQIRYTIHCIVIEMSFNNNNNHNMKNENIFNQNRIFIWALKIIFSELYLSFPSTYWIRLLLTFRIPNVIVIVEILFE